MSVSEMHVMLIFLSLLWQILIIHATIIPATHPIPDSIAISCDGSGSSAAPGGRVWVGDSGLQFSSSIQINGEPSNSRATHKHVSEPYKTARVSRHDFSYIFPVKPGQKFVRMHFNQDSYEGFKKSQALFSVKAGPYTLLSSFRGEQSIKEYCVNIDDGPALTITFSPVFSLQKGRWVLLLSAISTGST